jgi:trans-2,3-dihydro-3-hydroxyanthranilate isomerase
VARARIFTPAKEMRFAGHPTVGAAFVLIARGVAPSAGAFRLDEEIGPIDVTVETDAATGDPLIWLTTPPIDWGPTYDRALAAQSLGLDAADLLPMAPQWASAGNPTIYVAVKDPASVDRAWCDLANARAIRGGTAEPTCVFVFAPTPGGAYSRMFATEYGIPEDPATGSSTGPLVAYMPEARAGAHGAGHAARQRARHEDGTPQPAAHAGDGCRHRRGRVRHAGGRRCA